MEQPRTQSKTNILNNHYQQQHQQQQQSQSQNTTATFEGAMDMMDFTMFPLDHSATNTNQVSNTGGEMANQNDYFLKSQLDNNNNSNQSFIPLDLNNNSTSDELIDSYSNFNSDDLIFSKQSNINFNNNNNNNNNVQFKYNENDGIFNNDTYYVNGLITPSDSDNHDVYSLNSKSSISSINEFNLNNNNNINNINNNMAAANNNIDFNNQILSFDNNINNINKVDETELNPYNYEVDYYNNTGNLDDFNSYYSNTQLSSPLHSPNSVSAFEEFQYFTTNKMKQQQQQQVSSSLNGQLLKNSIEEALDDVPSPKFIYTSKKKTSSIPRPSIKRHSSSAGGYHNHNNNNHGVTNAGISKPPHLNHINKRSKTLNDLNLIPTPSPPDSSSSSLSLSNSSFSSSSSSSSLSLSSSPSPIDFNPSIKNLTQWISVSPITDERYEKILELAAQRRLDQDKVEKVINSFRQKHILIKLNIINRKIGLDSKKFPVGSREKLPKLNILENPNSFKVIVSTSSGYDDLVGENESVPSGLRRLNILKDHVNYKLYDELASSCFESISNNKVFESTKSKNNKFSKNSSSSSSSNNFPKEEKIKRPLNQFMIYRTSMVRAANIFKIVELIKEDDLKELIKINQKLKDDPKSSILNEIVNVQPKLDHHLTAHVIALLWTTESPQVKEQFAQFAKLEKNIHSKVFPTYKFNPQKRNSNSK